MTELTGLESILSKSHFKSDKKNKYSFGKSQRFAPHKSKLLFSNTATPLTSLKFLLQETPELVPLAMEKNTSSLLQKKTPVLPSILLPHKKKQESHLVSEERKSKTTTILLKLWRIKYFCIYLEPFSH